MSASRIFLKSERLLDPSRDLDAPGTVVVEAGRIVAVASGGDAPPEAGPNDTVEDLGRAWLAPGLIDLRCCLAEPGFEHREDIHSGLTAAASGGFTAVCATPDTDPVTDSAAVVRQILERAATAGGARLLPVGAATAGLGDEMLAPMAELQDAGCVAVSQGELPISRARLMRRVLEYARCFDLPVMVTAVEPSLTGLCDEGEWSTRLGLPATPAAAEAIAVGRDLALAELTGGRLHLQRLTTAAAVGLVEAARDRGVRVTCDVTAHHLTLTTAALEGYDTNARVWPPLRSAADRDALRSALGRGVIDAVVSDHRPHLREDKARPYVDAATGISALETVVPLVLARVAAGDLTPLGAVRALSLGPASVLGMAPNGLVEGAEADLTALEPTRSWIPDRQSMRSRSINSPLLGSPLRGQAVLTMVGGTIVARADDGER